MTTDPFLIVGIFTSMAAGCSAIGGWIAYVKRRAPLEGVLLGLFLGPVGVLIESFHPYVQRPMVDKNAWNSLHSMMTYQQTSREFSRRTSRSGQSRRWL